MKTNLAEENASGVPFESNKVSERRRARQRLYSHVGHSDLVLSILRTTEEPELVTSLHDCGSESSQRMQPLNRWQSSKETY